jgi:hypothetical protein
MNGMQPPLVLCYRVVEKNRKRWWKYMVLNLKLAWLLSAPNCEYTL